VRDNVVAQWMVQGLSVVAFILLLKLGASFLPQQGILGSIRTVVGSL
jgi:hypothetical protein